MIHMDERRKNLILSKINKTDSCWLWTAYINPNGYGEFTVYENGKNIVFKSHRIVYELLAGKIPNGKQLDHLCRVRHCVNPKHLEPVTQKENILRGYGSPARNKRKTHCNYGHPYDKENTRYNAVGHRFCRACHRRTEGIRQRELYWKGKARRLGYVV